MSGPLYLSCLTFADAVTLHRTIDRLTSHAVELLPISTCQRHELFVLGERITETHFVEVDIGVTQLIAQDGDAACRLFQIAAGDLSLVPGEDAVADQVRQSLRQATQLGLVQTRLGRLTRRALRTAKAIRTKVRQSGPILELGDLVAQRIRQERPDHASGPVILIGAGAVARSTREAVNRQGIVVSHWANRTLRNDSARGGGPQYDLQAIGEHLPGAVAVISALAESPAIIDGRVLEGTLTIDLAVPGNIQRPTYTQASLVAAASDMLEPQRETLARATHRIPALAEHALAETVSPSIAPIANAIERFRDAIVEAELKRLQPILATLPPEEADDLRRSIRHTAARCTHPLHESINQLGRQGRVDDAAALIDHLLGSRVGYVDPSSIERQTS